MKCEKESVKQYVLSLDSFEVPEIQDRFSLSYLEIKDILEGLEKERSIEYQSGIAYKVIARNQQINGEKPGYVAQDIQEEFCIKALWECVKSGRASAGRIQHSMSCGYYLAVHALEWMKKNGYVGSGPFDGVKMTVSQFYTKYGNPQLVTNLGNDSDINFPELRSGVLPNPFHNALDNDDDEKNKEDASDDEEDTEDESFGVYTRRLNLEKRREELLEQAQRTLFDDDKKCDTEDDAESINRLDLKTILRDGLECGLKNTSEFNKYSLGFDSNLCFESRLADYGMSVKISDCGTTLTQVTQTKRKIQNVLKQFPTVEFDGKELFIKAKSPYGVLKAFLILYAAIDAVKKIK